MLHLLRLITAGSGKAVSLILKKYTGRYLRIKAVMCVTNPYVLQKTYVFGEIKPAGTKTLPSVDTDEALQSLVLCFAHGEPQFLQ